MKNIFGFQIVSRMPHSLRLICLFLSMMICLFPSVVFAYDISLSWDGSTDNDVDGYKVFKRTEGQAYDYNAPVYSGTAESCLLTGMDYDVKYYFVARSYRVADNETLESDNSNEINYERSTPAPVEDPSEDPVEDDTVVDDTVTDNGDNTEGNTPVVDTGNDTVSDGTLVIQNISSYTPMLTSPANGITLTTVTPTLTVAAYTNSSTSNVHRSTEWQISRDIDFTSLVFGKKSQFSLTSLYVTQLILNDDTTYFWRVRFVDNANTASAWSEAWEFTTAMTYIEDENQNGVPDDLEIDEYVDLDYNGIPDIHQNDIKCMNTTLGNGQIGIGIESGEGSVDMVQSIDWDLIGDSENRPKKMPMNLIGFRLLVETGAEVAVNIYFSEKLPRSAKWFKYDIENGWQDFSDHAVFSTTEDHRTRVTLYLQDGGFGDEDGIANGVIIDPSGPGFASLEESVTDMIDTTGSSDTVGADSGGGCFIGTGGLAQKELIPNIHGIFLILIWLAGLLRGRCNRK